MLAEPVRDLTEIEAAEWDELARQSGNPFATREWISTWWQVFGGEGSLLSFCARSAGGRLVALLPLYLTDDRELRFLGHRLADRLGPVCAPSDRSATARLMRSVLGDNHTRFDRFVGADLPADKAWGRAIGARRLRRTSSPVLRFEGRSWQAFLEARSGNFRQQARRRERRLTRELGLRYRLADDPSRLQSDLGHLLRLHDLRWGRTSRSFAGKRAVFHRAFAARALERGWLRLWIAEVEGRPAAAWYGFRYADAEWYYQAGRDPRYDTYSLGFVLLAHTIRTALDDGVREYKLLRGDEAYKQRFANHDEPVETVELTHAELV